MLKDMTKGSLGAQWQGYAKSAIGQAVLHMTKINEEARVPNPGMYSQTVSVCARVHVVFHSLYMYIRMSLSCIAVALMWLFDYHTHTHTRTLTH